MTINYKPGKDNIVPDALSRRHDYETVNAVSVITVEDMDPEIKKQTQEYSNDNTLGPLWETLQNQPSAKYKGKLCKLHEGWIVTQIQDSWRILVPTHATIPLATVAHKGTTWACGGVTKTIAFLQRTFYWPKMKNTVEKIVAECTNCLESKPMSGSHKTLLRSIPPPTQRWTQISVDFITELPTSKQNNDAIFTVVDSLTKMAHFIPCKKTVTAEQLTDIFKNQIWRLYRLPSTIISDRDPKFTSKFCTALTHLLGIKRTMSTAFHPETDGQTERCHRTIEQILRYFVSYQQRKWEQFIAQAEFTYNQARHSSTGHSPFFAMYGFQPKMDFPSFQNNTNESTQIFAQRMKNLELELRNEIARMQQKQKKAVDVHRKDREFEEGEWVWLNTGHLRFRFLSRKLAPRFVGPFKIKEKLSTVTYRLNLPNQWRIHDVFYVGLLKAHKEEVLEHSRVPVLILNDEDEYEVETIIRHRWQNNKYSFLVLWKGYPPSEATWQTAEDLRNAQRIFQKYCQQHQLHMTSANTTGVV